MLHKAIRQFLEDVEWGALDYLLIDLPPGTGDVTMTLAQLLPHSKFVIVTTPQDAAQKVARRAADTALRYDIEVLGVVENMYGEVFGEGGGQLLADELDVPLLGKIPLTEELRRASDAGTPLVLEDPDSPASQAISHAARGIIAASPVGIQMLAPPAPAGISGTPLPMAN
jgi:ATP-binding protein involved in chromosome partitioning